MRGWKSYFCCFWRLCFFTGVELEQNGLGSCSTIPCIRIGITSNSVYLDTKIPLQTQQKSLRNKAGGESISLISLRNNLFCIAPPGIRFTPPLMDTFCMGSRMGAFLFGGIHVWMGYHLCGRNVLCMAHYLRAIHSWLSHQNRGFWPKKHYNVSSSLGERQPAVHRINVVSHRIKTIVDCGERWSKYHTADPSSRDGPVVFCSITPSWERT